MEIRVVSIAQQSYSQTPAGQAEFFRQCELYYAACNDEKFQAFKALIPGLIPPSRKRRGRPPEDIRIAFLCPQSVRRRGGQDADTAHLSA